MGKKSRKRRYSEENSDSDYYVRQKIRKLEKKLRRRKCRSSSSSSDNSHGGVSASENSRFDVLRRHAEQPWPWDASPRISLDSPDIRYTHPESRYPHLDSNYHAARNHNSRYPSGLMSDNRYIGAPSDGDGFVRPDNGFLGAPSHSDRYNGITDSLVGVPNDADRYIGTSDNRFAGIPVEKRVADDETGDDYDKSLSDETFRDPSEKRSAVATALNAGRRRRQPAPALGVLNDVGSFFDSLRDNLETLASLSPQERATLFHDPPTVVHAPAPGGSGGGVGFRKLHALRPLRPTGNIRSYNRRSLVEAEDVYPAANRHDPGLLWTGLGR